jgi:hypothetical protein
MRADNTFRTVKEGFVYVNGDSERRHFAVSGQCAEQRGELDEGTNEQRDECEVADL